VRPAPVAVVSIVSAALGAGLVLAVGSALDWIGTDGTETIVVETTVRDESVSAASPQPAKPLPGNVFDPARIYAARAHGVVTIFSLFGDETATEATGQGSGFVVSDEGYILTNSHVITTAGEGAEGTAVRAADQVFVEFSDGDAVTANVVGWDVFDDVAVLKVDPGAHALAPVPLGDSAEVQVGEPVAAIGSPFGAESSLAVGVVSATKRSIDALTSRYQLVDAIQTDAPINRGNSGGPLFDASGRVIGINAQIRSNTGLSQGVGFAVPINAAKRSMKELIERGEVSYAFIGITTDDLTPALGRHLRLAARRGALIADVPPGPARRAGMRGGTRRIVFQGREVTVGGDVVVAVGSRPVRSGNDLVRIVTNDLRPGEAAVFTVVRGSRRLDLRLTVGKRPIAPAGG
jgi:2-alkenal reductase